MIPRLRTSLAFLAAAVLAVAGVMLATAVFQRSAGSAAADRSESVSELLRGHLEQQAGARGYLLTAAPRYLAQFDRGAEIERRAAESLNDRLSGSREGIERLDRYRAEARLWAGLAVGDIRATEQGDGAARTRRSRLERSTAADRLRRAHASLERQVQATNDSQVNAAIRWAVLGGILLTGLAGGLTVAGSDRERRRRTAAARVSSHSANLQHEFTEVIQLVSSENEAHELLKRHLELTIPDARATVLNRNPGENRLDTVTVVEDDSVLATTMLGAEHESCVAIRLGRRYDHVPGTPRLLACQLCGGSPGRSTCEPLLVSGKVTGSVLVEHADELGETGNTRLTDSVAQAAPVLANLRNLAMAEERAATDALTGLPNRRSMQDQIKRMVAQASRSLSPMAVLAIDLDRFKSINDEFGHEAGDKVLVHTAEVLRSSIRQSDFVSRIGGEEFVIIAPDTGIDGALVLAENVRMAIAESHVPGLQRQISASIGIAVMPDHGTHGDSLMRMADRGLYQAKEAGRNRVEVGIPGGE